ncbi:protein kinase [Streptomyces sp. NPDC052052]|uniref:serine/threonine protein kinase n=1 Tax=Streptomyces sp. NPDC052052 TaxID=3154756 RepID=UPI00343E1F01
MAGHVLGGRYELTERIGAGGMGVVWSARDRLLHRTVAVKVLSGAGGTPDAAVRLEREARAAAGLSENRHVVTVHDFGRDGDTVYVVMERVSGRTLDAFLRAEGPPGPALAVEWVRQVCAALEAAHAAGVVHRDIKPANVILTPDGTVKVLDFGIAWFHPMHGLERISRDLVAGSAPWMSPEQIQGAQMDHRSDLYSTGCLLYELLTGRTPFGDRDTYSLFVAHVTEPVVAPGLLRPGIPAALDTLTLRLLAKSPNDRPGSASEVAARLGAVGRDLGAVATTPYNPSAPPTGPGSAVPAALSPAPGPPPAVDPAALASPSATGGGRRWPASRRTARTAALGGALAVLATAGVLWLNHPDGSDDSGARAADRTDGSHTSAPASGADPDTTPGSATPAPAAPSPTPSTTSGTGKAADMRFPRTATGTSPLPSGWRLAHETRYRMDLPVPADFTGSDNDGKGMIYEGPGGQIVISVYHDFDVAKATRTSLQEQLAWYRKGADGTMSEARSDGIKDVILLGLPGAGFEVTYHKTDSSQTGSRHHRIERGVQDAEKEELYFRVEYPDTPEYDARARKVLATMQDRIVLHPR